MFIFTTFNAYAYFKRLAVYSALSTLWHSINFLEIFLLSLKYLIKFAFALFLFLYLFSSNKIFCDYLFGYKL